jgi:hypothetical protein
VTLVVPPGPLIFFSDETSDVSLQPTIASGIVNRAVPSKPVMSFFMVVLLVMGFSNLRTRFRPTPRSLLCGLPYCNIHAECVAQNERNR